MLTASRLGLIFALMGTVVHGRRNLSEGNHPRHMTRHIPRTLETIGGDRTGRRAKDSNKGKGGKKTSKHSHMSLKKSRKTGKGSKGSGDMKRRRSFCSAFDFQRFNSSDIMANIFSGVVGKGKPKGRRQGERSLQVGNQDCAANGLDIARENPNLSIFVDLLEFADLEEIFTCAVRNSD